MSNQIEDKLNPCPNKKKYGWHEKCGIDDDETGWLFEEGKYAYQKAIEAYNKQELKIKDNQENKKKQ